MLATPRDGSPPHAPTTKLATPAIPSSFNASGILTLPGLLGLFTIAGPQLVHAREQCPDSLDP
jgi:hypothetical protein